MSLSLRMTISRERMRAGVVHRLIGHARRHRAVADHRDDAIVAPVEIARHRHAERRRDRGRGMRGAERVVFALRPLGEAGKAAALAQRADAVAPAGQDLVRIGLVADVPDQPVARRVEDVVQRDRQFDHAEPRAEMAAGDRNRADRLGAQFVGELARDRFRSAREGRPARRCGPGAALPASSLISRMRGALRHAAPQKKRKYTGRASAAIAF